MKFKKHHFTGRSIQYSLLFGEYVVFALALYCSKSGWFRLFGIGLSWTHNSNPKLFSERIGKRKKLTLSNYRIGYLRKFKKT